MASKAAMKCARRTAGVNDSLRTIANDAEAIDREMNVVEMRDTLKYLASGSLFRAEFPQTLKRVEKHIADLEDA